MNTDLTAIENALGRELVKGREYEKGTAHLVNCERYDRGPHRVKYKADAALSERDRLFLERLGEVEAGYEQRCLEYKEAIAHWMKRAEQSEARVLNLTIATIGIAEERDKAEAELTLAVEKCIRLTNSLAEAEGLASEYCSRLESEVERLNARRCVTNVRLLDG